MARALSIGRLRRQVTFVTRLVVTAMISYFIALWLLPAQAPLLAPLTALLVVQATTYQTLWSAVQRVISVTAGVIVAVGLADLLGYSWWTLTIAITLGLVLGIVLRLGNNILEVPISAMLILQLNSGAAATDRIAETLIGAAVGLLAGLVASPVRARDAQVAVRSLGETLADLLDDMAGGLDREPERSVTDQWMDRSRRLSQQILRADAVLTSAEESARLNPRTATRPGPDRAMRNGLETLDHAASTIRGLTRCIMDRTNLFSDDREGLGKEMWEADVRDHLAPVLRALARALRAYGSAAGSAERTRRLLPEIRRGLAAGRRDRDALSWLLREDPGHWPLHGELLVHLDRLLDGLSQGLAPLAERPPERPPTVLPIPPIKRRRS